jgi:hypothetical protein
MAALLIFDVSVVCCRRYPFSLNTPSFDLHKATHEKMSDSDGEGVIIELDAAATAAIAAVREVLQLPVESVIKPVDLQERLVSAGAPLRIEHSASRGRCLVATRDIAAGEVLLQEDASAWSLTRSPGSDGVFALRNECGQLVATLPQWHTLRLLRDTLSFPIGSDPEAAYAYVSQLLSDPSEGNFASASRVPETAPGVPATPENVVPRRAQLLASIAQCNAFTAALPAEDSDWKRGLLWQLLGRITDPADRDLLFDDEDPLSTISSFFVLGGLFNHSCDPNVRYTSCSWEAGMNAPRIIFTAGRDIACGAEACCAYLDPDELCESRRNELLVTYGFVCTCHKCEAEVGGDSLAAAGHYPNGFAARARAAFFASGGEYPSLEISAPVVEATS